MQVLRKEFIKFLLPSIIAFLLTGFYSIVDGFFVGQAIGDPGLSAINIAYPIIALFQAIGTGVGMGGAIQYSLTHSTRKKNNILFVTISLLFALSSLILMLFLIIGDELIYIQGANDLTNTLAIDYLYVCTFGCFLQVFSTGLVPLLRNFGNAFVAMIVMVTGCITNIVLDYLFVMVYKIGIKGAAYATLIGQAVSLILIISFLIYKKVKIFNKLSWKMFKYSVPILRSSLSPIGNTYSPMITLVLINFFTLKFSDNALSCYSTIAYVTTIIQLLLQGVGDGSQPLFSKYYGNKDFNSVKILRKYAYITVLVFALLSMILIGGMYEIIPELFGNSEEVSLMFEKSIFYFVASFIFLGIVRCTISYFYAIDNPNVSNIITYLEPFILLINLNILPYIFDLDGVWLSALLTQVIMSIIAMINLFVYRNLTKKYYVELPKVSI